MNIKKIINEEIHRFIMNESFFEKKDKDVPQDEYTYGYNEYDGKDDDDQNKNLDAPKTFKNADQARRILKGMQNNGMNLRKSICDIEGLNGDTSNKSALNDTNAEVSYIQKQLNGKKKMDMKIANKLLQHARSNNI